MIPLYNSCDLNDVKYRNFLPLQCKQCKHVFFRTKEAILKILRPKSISSGEYCSQKCSYAAHTYAIQSTCTFCNCVIVKARRDVKRTKHSFCSRSCNAKYTNSHKTFGNPRSKLEVWIEKELIFKYPNLKIEFNNRTTLDSNLELDIYIPSLNLAFELNGVHHYKPIYGLDKLKITQQKDQVKINDCKVKDIKLYIIDISNQKNFTEKTSKQYLNYIVSIIDQFPV